MNQMSNPMEILKVLEKSNCGECNETTCLAFAAAVARKLKMLNECPRLEKEILKQLGGEISDNKPSEQDAEELLMQLKARLRGVDLAEAAKRLGAIFKDNRITIKVLGKNFSVDANGNFYSEIHVHSWLTGPVLSYILDGEGIDPTGSWLPFRELKGGKDWGRFFEHRCEKPMKKVADTYTDFFEDMLHVFSGRQLKGLYDSDISLVLHPLPKFPVLICYWRPEDGLESDMHIFFDSTAEKNLNIESIYGLMTGLLVMFEKITHRHNL